MSAEGIPKAARRTAKATAGAGRLDTLGRAVSRRLCFSPAAQSVMQRDRWRAPSNWALLHAGCRPASPCKSRVAFGMSDADKTLYTYEASFSL